MEWVVACGCLNLTATASPDGAVGGTATEDCAAAAPPPPRSALPPAHFFGGAKLASARNVRESAGAFLVRRSEAGGGWQVVSCALCGAATHAVRPQDGRALLDLEKQVRAQSLQEETKVSPAFGIDVTKLKGAADERQPSAAALRHPAAEVLQRRLDAVLREKLEAAEREIRLFREARLREYEAFSMRARRDCHAILNSLPPVEERPREPEAAAVPPALTPRLADAAAPASKKSRGLPRHRRSSPNNNNSKEDSLDSEGIFDLEGAHEGDDAEQEEEVEEEEVDEESESDEGESDLDDSTSRDEGIHIRPADQQWRMNMAKSLPVNVPNFPHCREVAAANRHDQIEEDPQDIAASMKALARSVYGDVFGDLPRPRFSTQI